jgi:hypothetical protein
MGQIRPHSASRIWQRPSVRVVLGRVYKANSKQKVSLQMGSKRLSVASRMQALPRTLKLILLQLPVALVVLIFLDTSIFMYRWFDKLIVPDAYHWLLLFISFAPLVYFAFRPSIGRKLYLIAVAAVLGFVLLAMIGAFFL